MEKWLYDCEINKIIDDDMTWPIGSMYAIYGNIYHQYTPNVSIYTIHGSYGWWINDSMLNFTKYGDRRRARNDLLIKQQTGVCLKPGKKPQGQWKLTGKSGGFSLNVQTVSQFWSWWCLPWYSQSHIFIGSLVRLPSNKQGSEEHGDPSLNIQGMGPNLGGHKGTVAASYAARSYGILKVWALGKFWSNVYWKLLEVVVQIQTLLTYTNNPNYMLNYISISLDFSRYSIHTGPFRCIWSDAFCCNHGTIVNKRP